MLSARCMLRIISLRSFYFSYQLKVIFLWQGQHVGPFWIVVWKKPPGRPWFPKIKFYFKQITRTKITWTTITSRKGKRSHPLHFLRHPIDLFIPLDTTSRPHTSSTGAVCLETPLLSFFLSNKDCIYFNFDDDSFCLCRRPAVPQYKHTQLNLCVISNLPDNEFRLNIFWTKEVIAESSKALLILESNCFLRSL